MKRPSNLIIAFIIAIATIFGIYALSRIVLTVVQAPVVEVKEE